MALGLAERGADAIERWIEGDEAKAVGGFDVGLEAGGADQLAKAAGEGGHVDFAEMLLAVPTATLEALLPRRLGAVGGGAGAYRTHRSLNPSRIGHGTLP